MPNMRMILLPKMKICVEVRNDSIHRHSSRATLQALLKMFHSRNTDPLPTSWSRMSRHAAKWEEFRSRK